MLSKDTPAEVSFILCYFDIQKIIKQLYLSQKFRINFFVILCNIMFFFRQVHLRPPKSFYHRHKANIEIWVSIRGQTIVVREIVTMNKSSGFSDLRKCNTVTNHC